MPNFAFSTGTITDIQTNTTQTIHDVEIESIAHGLNWAARYGITPISRMNDSDIPELFNAVLELKYTGSAVRFEVQNCRRTGYKMFEFDRYAWRWILIKDAEEFIYIPKRS